MKKKGFLHAYFLIKSNAAYEHSFAVRVKYVGLNLALGGWAVAQLWFDLLRPKAAIGEKFSE